ncbi:hypothetical protein IE53DRAFT_388778 [Violaceomyces palustris]|uniref:Uncharacterized protein n=1 Tax=Violaceomyces palustris TaxID=1673888 RepID=A0ACD0NT80_9BASI|nr:hypothetical protein IE53DRAFT_388778 [Violaceomyces palustris]
MPGILSLHRHEDHGSSHTNIRDRLFTRNRVRSPDRNENDLEMNARAPAEADQPSPQHQRDGSHRSILSSISILPTLAAMRQQERDQELENQIRRAEANRPPSPTPAQLEAGQAAVQLAPPAGIAPNADPVSVETVASAPVVVPPTSSSRKAAKTRREREEAATLFGPNLANYFGSGSSSSGTVSGSANASSSTNVNALNVAGSSAAAAAAATATANSDLTNAFSAARRARLGSRGRARGASLSGLSVLSFGGESISSVGGANSPDPSAIQAPNVGMDQSTWLAQQANEKEISEGDVAMSEGIDLETLKRWIEKSAVGDGPGHPPLCTTLQAYVNLKRNTVRMMPKSKDPDQGASSPPDSDPEATKKMARLASASDVNLLRTAPSLSLLPNLSNSLNAQEMSSSDPAATPASLLPATTHSLYFEYDCATPNASVQVFVRASRKHGSWASYIAPLGGVPMTGVKNPMLAQRGPPPHVLGWPVHVAKLQTGFGVGHKASIALNLDYYAPPGGKNGGSKQANDDGDKDKAKLEDETVERDVQGFEGVTGDANGVPETPAWDLNRRLEIETEDAEDEARATRPRLRVPVTTAAVGDTTTAATGSPALAAVEPEPVSEPETKEQRLAREKAERETLKVAIVIEALDESSKPLREPNLQTTYLRITSLPAKRSDDSPLMPGERVWSVQVEGQEAEIGPHRFQLQELYGLSSKPPPVKPAPVGGEGGDGGEGGEGDEEGNAGATTVGGLGETGLPSGFLPDIEGSDGTECLICLSSPPTTLLLPCTHGLCLECAVQLRESVLSIRQSERRRGRTPRRKYACPVCRRGYTSMLHLSKADEKLVAQARSRASNVVV